MWFRDVNVPDELITAQREGRLVLFVGAGASVDPPSGLPTFVTLAERIASESAITFTGHDRDHPDRFLGDLDLDGPIGKVDVHRRVADHIGSPTSQPNDLHRAIAALAATSPIPRVVTTNYDRHLSVSLGPLTEFTAPALPMGDDFEGLVYLHGSLNQDPRLLVVTDGDFGRAYLTDAWAAGFLERMFRRFVVLFVGYSHDDIVMSYLARGLPRGNDRYVLTAEPSLEKWRRLGIQPVPYSCTATGTHEAVQLSLNRWAELMRWGLLDHERRIKDLVSKPPSLVPEEQSYLEEAVADETKVRFFTEHAKTIEWLKWIEGLPVFQRLFDLRVDSSAAADALGWWFAETFVADPVHSDQALSILSSRGGQVSESLWFAIAQRLHIGGKPRPPHLDRWLVLLLETAPHRSGSLIDYALDACEWPEDRHAALILFDHLTTPRLVFDRFGSSSGGPRMTVAIAGEDYWLDSAWQKFFEPHLADLASDLIAIADHHLRAAHRLLVVSDRTRSGFDPLSYGRSAIERHGQDSHKEGINCLIDVARETLVLLLRDSPELGRGYLRSWGESDVQLLRRLALHGWAHRSDSTSDEKLGWLMSTGWLYSWELQHEVFAVLACALPGATESVGRTLLDQVLAGPNEVTEYAEYNTYNLLVWLASSVPESSDVAAALAAMQSDHPDFAPLEHPDFTSWHEVGTFGHQAPMEPTELHSDVKADPRIALDAVLSYKDNASPWNGPTWGDALRVLSSTVAQNPDDGHTILAALDEEELRVQITVAIIEGWGRAELDEIAYIKAAQTLVGMLDDPSVVIATARFLRDHAKADGESAWAKYSSGARSLALATWQAGAAIADDRLGPADEDWLGLAVNHWGGWLAEFWVLSVSAEWRADTDGWTGLPDEAASAIGAMLEGADEAHCLAQVFLASQLLFLFGADPDWCKASVLPLLDWDRDAGGAARSWDGFLKWGRFNDRLLEAGLLDLYLKAASRVGSLSDESQQSLCRHLASIAVQSEVDPRGSGWLATFTAGSDEAMRVGWMRAVSWLLADLPTDVVEAAWSRWMKAYWENRLASVPAAMTNDEASAMAEWVTALDASFAQGVDLAVMHVAGLQEHTSLVHRLPASELVKKHPSDTARLLAHLLRGTTRRFYDWHSLEQLVPILRAGVGVDGVKGIVEQALRLGCSGAASW